MHNFKYRSYWMRNKKYKDAFLSNLRIFVLNIFWILENFISIGE